jgi:hypothetical protein
MTTLDKPGQSPPPLPGDPAATPAPANPPAAPRPPAVEPVVLYRIAFRAVPDATPAAKTILRFDGASPSVAEVETLSADSFVELAQETPGSDEMLLLFLSDHTPDQEQWRHEAEAWMDDEEPEGFGPALRATTDGGWVLWRPGRAVVLAPPARCEELLSAVADFAFHDGELRKIEASLEANWPHLQQDLPLVHKVGRKELARTGHVGKMTALAMDWRLKCARIERRLLAPPSDAPAGGRRAGEKLRALARVEERLETLDGQIEVYEYAYEMINQRLSDYRHYRRELLAEIIIIALLVVEVAIMLTDFYWKYFGPESPE